MRNTVAERYDGNRTILYQLLIIYVILACYSVHIDMNILSQEIAFFNKYKKLSLFHFIRFFLKVPTF